MQLDIGGFDFYRSIRPAARPGRAFAMACAFVALMGVAAPLPSAWAQQQPDRGGSAQQVRTEIINKMYSSAMGRVARGDPAGAVKPLEVLVDIAPELHELQYSLALAMVLADFNARDRVAPAVGKALASDPANPLYQVVSILADPRQSRIKSDGALYLTRDAGDLMNSAAQRAASSPAARNARFLAPILSSLEPSGDPQMPYRLRGFDRMIGPGGSVKMPQWTDSIAFGQLLALNVPADRFAPYEPRIIARLQNGLESLSQDNQRLSSIRNRIQSLRTQLVSAEGPQRTVVVNQLDQALSEMDEVIVRNETVIASLRAVIDNLTVDQRLAGVKQELARQEQELAKVRQENQEQKVVLAQAKGQTFVAQKTLAQTLKANEDAQAKLNQAQNKLNDLQGKLAKAETALQTREQTMGATEKGLQERQAELAALREREESLRKQQQASLQAASSLDTIKRQQASANDQLAKLQADIAQMESQKAQSAQAAGELEALRRQQREAQAQAEAIRAQVEAGERARNQTVQQAEQSKRELQNLQGQLASVEREANAEQAKLAAMRKERDQLERQVSSLMSEQKQVLEQRAREAQLAKQVDFGRYYALVIGTDKYRNWEGLDTAVADARAIGTLLEKKYGFKVKSLYNANRGQILDALTDFVDELGPRDNLLIYYAGHGIVDSAGGGYWVPTDGDPMVEGRTLRTGNMVRHEDVINVISRMQAKQVMVIADSCFSGGLTSMVTAGAAAQQSMQVADNNMRGVRTRGARRVDPAAAAAAQPVPQAAKVAAQESPNAVVSAQKSEDLYVLEHMASRGARVVLTSGGNEPVVDRLKPTDKNSVFSSALLNALEKNQGVMKSIDLTSQVQQRVLGATGPVMAKQGGVSQTPSFNYLAGYNGDFLFVARN